MQSQLAVLIRKTPSQLLATGNKSPRERTLGEAAQRHDGAFREDFLLYEP